MSVHSLKGGKKERQKEGGMDERIDEIQGGNHQSSKKLAVPIAKNIPANVPQEDFNRAASLP